MTAGVFHHQWFQVVSQWLSTGRRPTRQQVDDLLARGLESVVSDLGETPTDANPSETDLLRCEMAVVARSALVDLRDYTSTNAPVRHGKVGAVEHFCTVGWQKLRNPGRGFDVWWYWSEYLDPTLADCNPLLHYELVGRHRGYAPLPSVVPPRRPTSYPADHRPRRACLFAGYDRDGVIDDYVVEYVRELSRHADVYYLSDGYIEPHQLARLESFTLGAWAVAHGGYDFGSYSMLARDLVGWDVLEGYDEVMFANDSAFLLRPLDDVFSRMDGAACDWWGLQATKHGFERHSNGGRPLEPGEMKRRMVTERLMNDLDHLHLSSYFLVFRAPVVKDLGFRRRLDSVTPQPHKELVIHKYEIGLSRYLMGRGFDFETFIPGLYPFHPLYTEQYFELLELGFPLLKRNFLSENSKNVPDLVQWKERVRRAVPDADVEMAERNLLRVAPDDVLQRSFSLVSTAAKRVPARRLAWWEFVQEDRLAPKFDHWWAFPVGDDHHLPGGARAVFEAVREDPTIKKVVLTRSRRVDLDGENVAVLPLNSPRGQHHLARARHIFVCEAPGTDLPPLVPPGLHRVINLGPLPLLLGQSAGTPGPARHWSTVTSSRLSALAVAVSHEPLQVDDIWTTGDPRNDMVLCQSAQLPPDLQDQENRLLSVVAERRLVLYEPSYHAGQPRGGYRRFDQAELDWLVKWCARKDAVIGFRDHPADNSRELTQALSSLGALSLPRNRFSSLEVVDRVASALVTDLPARAAEFAITAKPLVLLRGRRLTGCRGSLDLDALLDLDAVVPAAHVHDLPGFADALERLFEPGRPDEHGWQRSLLFEHRDAHNARRLVTAVKRRYLVKS